MVMAVLTCSKELVNMLDCIGSRQGGPTTANPRVPSELYFAGSAVNIQAPEAPHSHSGLLFLGGVEIQRMTGSALRHGTAISAPRVPLYEPRPYNASANAGSLPPHSSVHR